MDATCSSGSVEKKGHGVSEMKNQHCVMFSVKAISKIALLILMTLVVASCASAKTVDKAAESPFGIAYYHADPLSKDSVYYGSYYYYDFTTGQSSRLTPTDQIIDGEIRSIHWSPIQHQFVYGAGRLEETGIFASDLTGKNYRRLTPLDGEVSHAYWSPDGLRIAYLFRIQVGSDQLAYVMKSDGSDQHTLFNNPRIVSGGAMRWSPNSRWIAVNSSDLDQNPLYSGTNIITNLYIVDADTGQILHTFADGSIHLSMDWSPDGQSLAYSSNQDGNLSLYIWNLNTGTQQKIENVDGVLNVNWSPDGKWIAFTTAS